MQYCSRNDLPMDSDIKSTMQRITFDDYDALQREFTSKSILKCIACKSDNVDWRSVQRVAPTSRDTNFAECKTLQKVALSMKLLLP